MARLRPLAALRSAAPLVIAAALALPLPAAAADKTVKIGLLAQLTGNSSADGQELIRGAQMAIDEVNAAGGVAGYTFELASATSRTARRATSPARPSACSATPTCSSC